MTVLLPELAPSGDGEKMLALLRGEGINAHLVSDASVFTVMSTVTTVFTSVQAIFADGTMTCRSFFRPVASAARYWAKPVVVLYARGELSNSWARPVPEPGDPRGVVPPGSEAARRALIVNTLVEAAPVSLVQMLINVDLRHGPEETFGILQDWYGVE